MSTGRYCDYDTMVRWDKRLPREAPLFEKLFATHGVTSLADVGCGTGRHAVMFAGWGIEVWALDPDEEMLATARKHAHDVGANIHFALAGFGEVAKTVGEVDGVVCLGNAFPHVGDAAGLRSTLADFAAAIRPGGPLVVHMLNHDRIESRGLRSLPTAVRSSEDGESVTVKIIDHFDDHFTFEFTQLTRPGVPGDAEGSSDWKLESRRSRHMKILSETMREELAAAGFVEAEVFGDHTGRPLDADADESAIWVAIRG